LDCHVLLFDYWQLFSSNLHDGSKFLSIFPFLLLSVSMISLSFITAAVADAETLFLNDDHRQSRRADGVDPTRETRLNCPELN
jgi:hypothetical protein